MCDSMTAKWSRKSQCQITLRYRWRNNKSITGVMSSGRLITLLMLRELLYAIAS